jgi:hypothetical protein
MAPHIGFGAGLVPGVFPVHCADYLAEHGFDGRLFNTIDLGGYLAWRAVGPFQDGRGIPLAEDVDGALAGPLLPWLFEPLDRRYRFDALLVTYPITQPQAFAIAMAGGYDPDPRRWALVAFDDAGLLYLRRDGKYAALATGDAYRVIAPANPILRLPPPDPAGAVAEYRRSVRENPDCMRCRYLLGELALATGDAGEAARTVAPALRTAYGPLRTLLESVAARARAAGSARLGGER